MKNIVSPPNFNYQSGDSLAINVTFKNVPNGRNPGFTVMQGNLEKVFVKRGETSFQFNEKLTSQSVSLDLDLAEGDPVYTLYKGEIQPHDIAVCGASSFEFIDIDYSNSYTGQVFSVESNMTEKCVAAKYGSTKINDGSIRIKSTLDISENGGEYQEETYPDRGKRNENTTKDGKCEEKYSDKTRHIVCNLTDGSKYIEITYSDKSRHIENNNKEGNKYQEDTYSDGTKLIVNTFVDGSEYSETIYLDGTRRIENTTTDGNTHTETIRPDGNRKNWRRSPNLIYGRSTYSKTDPNDDGAVLVSTESSGNRVSAYSSADMLLVLSAVLIPPPNFNYQSGDSLAINVTFKNVPKGRNPGFKVIHGSAEKVFVKRGETSFQFSEKLTSQSVSLDLDLAEGDSVYTLYIGEIQPHDYAACGVSSFELNFDIDFSNTYTGQVVNVERKITQKCVVAKYGITISNAGFIRIRSILDISEDGGEYQEKTYTDGAKRIQNTTKDGNNYQENTYADGTRRIVNTLKDGSEYKESTYSDGTKRIENTTKDEKYQENTYSDGTRRIAHTFKDGSKYIERTYSDKSRHIENTDKEGNKYQEDIYSDGTKRIVHTFVDGSEHRETTYSDGTRRIVNTTTDGNTHTETIRPDGNRRKWRRSSDVIYGTSSSSKTDPNDDGAVLVSTESSGNRGNAYSSADMMLVLSAVLSVLHKLFH
ncbi:hypothetical protein B5X24_HaOG202357 [Helicoverpa armigera]|nr:hypothetical protein B5X24_HaOG202357 [Helicoverpa armigera]